MDDLVFDIKDCTEIDITTPNIADSLDLISEMQVNPLPNSRNYQDYAINFGNNCCKENVILAPVNYTFTRVQSSCGSNGGPMGNTNYEFTINGINPLFVTSLQISYDNQVSYSNSPFNNNAGNIGFVYNAIYYTPDVSLPMASFGQPVNTLVLTHYIKINHISGFKYVIKLSLTLTQPGGCNVTNSSIIQVIYPAVNPRLSFTGSILNMLTLFDIGVGESISSGVYAVIICRRFLNNPLLISSLSSNCVQNSIFVDCNMKCDIVSKLIQCRLSNVYTIYQALLDSNSCTTSYEDKCDLYSFLTRKLENPDCADPFDDCNCVGNSNSGFTQRPYNPSSNSGKPGCGCSK